MVVGGFWNLANRFGQERGNELMKTFHRLLLLQLACSVATIALVLTKSQAGQEPSYAHERTDWTTRELRRTEARDWVIRARPFALMSELAYQGSQIKCRRKALQQKFRAELTNEGWQMLTNRVKSVPANRDADEDSPGLHFYIWEKRTGPQRYLAIAFRGTEFKDFQDWRANLRWFLPFCRKSDQYAQAHQQILQYLRDTITPADSNTTIITTGHSLGGGIAQSLFYASYALPEPAHVTQCFAFDPSPVTAAFQIGSCEDRKAARAARNSLQSKLAKDKVRGESALQHINFGTARIYEQGEILSYIRGPLRRLWPLHSLITEIRFDMTKDGNGISQHGISHLAEALFEYRPTN